MPVTPLRVDTPLLDLVLSAGLATQVTLAILLALSVACWAVILYKWRAFRRAARSNARFLALLKMNQEPNEIAHLAQRQPTAPAATLFLAIYRHVRAVPDETPAPASERPPSRPARAGMEETAEGVSARLVMEAESYLVILATTANAAPFIGLFGTVLGIITAFQAIGRHGSASLATVAPGIAEALVATAAGLLAAIPAVVAYNLFVQRVRRLSVELEGDAREIISRFRDQSERATVGRDRPADARSPDASGRPAPPIPPPPASRRIHP